MVHTSAPGKGEKRVLLLLVLVGALAAGLIFWRGLAGRAGAEDAPQAAIYYDGRRVALLNLSDYEDSAYFSMKDFGVEVPVHFEIRARRIRFVDVECPDGLCEGFGFINLPTQTAVCMPNRVSVNIVES